MEANRFVSSLMVAALVGAPFVFTSTAQSAPDKPVVKGTFLGDGKDGNIQHLVVQTREPFSDKPAIQLVFTEKDSSKSKKPDFDAGFKKFGNALIISVFKDGDIFGCEVAHTAHSKSPFSALGQIKTQDFQVTDTEVTGRIVTPGELDAFGQKWQVDLTFSAPLPKGAFAAAAEPTPEPTKPGKGRTKDNDEAPTVTGPKMSVKQLPLPSGARDVEYKSVVEQIALNADASVSTVAGELAKKLKEQGWKEGPGSLMGKNNAILKRKLNGADLTIMVQPAGKGCTVKIFAEGLDWSDAPAAGAAKPTKAVDAEGIEAEANRLLKDALKQIPGGLK